MGHSQRFLAALQQGKFHDKATFNVALTLQAHYFRHTGNLYERSCGLNTGLQTILITPRLWAWRHRSKTYA